MNIWVTGGSGEVFGDIALNVHAEVGPCLVGMVVLAVSLCENGVRREYLRSKGKHDRAFDCDVGWSMVHWFVVGVEYCPCKLVVGVVILVGEKFRKVGICWWNWQVV